MRMEAFYLLCLMVLVSGCLDILEEDEAYTPSATEPGPGPGPQPPPALPSSPVSAEGQRLFGFEADPEGFIDDDGRVLETWFDEAAARGVNMISFEVFNLDGEAIFDSPVLREAGFTLLPDMENTFAQVLKEASSHDMMVVVMLEGIAHIVYDMKSYSDSIRPERLTPEATKRLIRDLAEEAREQRAEVAVDEEAFPDIYIDAIRAAASEHGMEYMHFFEDLRCRPDVFISEDYAYYPLDARNSPADAGYLRQLYSWGSYYGKLGFLNIMFGAAIGCGKRAGVGTAGGWGLGPKTHQNIALMRAVQFSPSLYMFIVGEGDEGPTFPEELPHVDSYNFRTNLLPLIEEYGRKPSDKPKKTANLIVDEPRKRDSDLMDFFTDALLSSSDAITNAILAAGYGLVVTSSPIDNADLYYVFSPGMVFDEGQDLPPELASLVDGGAPVFYQVVGELPDAPNWKKVIRALGIEGSYAVLVNADERSFYDPIPEEVEYVFPTGRHRVKYGGYSFEVWDPELLGRYSVGHYLHYLNPADIGSEVLLQGLSARDADGVFDDPTALIIKRGNAYFVNGGYLHLDASHVLANIMAGLAGVGPVYNAPSYGYFTNGESRAVFFAPYDIEVDLNVLGGSRVTVFDEEGRRVTTSLALENGRLRGEVKRFNLVIVD
jgi:hypothetical protein